ncbi:MAG TPA: acyltransferase family protein [Alphaproteobacteria bacterium]|nr:acyltransferase family protein [Alphaproteobacteria bacterium]
MSNHAPTPIFETKRYRPDIDGLRAFAVLVVVAFHAFPPLLTGGFVGVDVFFVISGFLITGIILDGLGDGDFSFARFYAHRIRRIFPALIAVLLAVLGAAYMLLPPHDMQEIAKQVMGGAGFASNFVFWKEAGYFDGASATKPLLHLWSLGIEEQFYILWPLLLFLSKRMRAPAALAIALIAASSLVFNFYAAMHNTVADFYSPFSRAWELALGGLLACSDRSKTAFKIRNRYVDTQAAFGIALIVFSCIGISPQDIYPGWWAQCPAFGAALLISAGPKAWFNRNILARRWVVAIGLISYPLYLWHWPLLAFARIFQLPEYSVPAAVILSFLLAWFTYYVIERPIRFGPRSKTKLVTLCALMALAFAGGCALYRNVEVGSYTGDPMAWPFWSDSACEQKYGMTPCETNSALPNIMILGDSHANQLYPGFAYTTPTTSVLSAGTCLPLAGIFLRTERNGAENPCEKNDFLTANVMILRNNPQIKTVIVSARWRHVLSGQIQNPTEHELWGGVKLFSGIPGEKESSQTELIDRGLTRTLQYLSDNNYKIIFMRGQPEIDEDIENYCHLRDKPSPNCTVPRAEFNKQRAKEDQMMALMQKKFPEMKVYDPADDLCDKTQCYLIRDGQMIYRDNHHFSVAGSIFLVGRLKAWMAKNNLLP